MPLNRNAVALLGVPIVTEEERATEAGIIPGHVVNLIHGSDGVELADGYEAATFALERDELGDDLDEAYGVSDIVKVGHFAPGMRVYGFLSGEAVEKGDFLTVGAAGVLEKADAGFARALEDTDPDGGTVRVRAEIVGSAAAAGGGGGGAAVGDIVTQDVTITEADAWNGSGDLPLEIPVAANRKLLAVQLIGPTPDLEAGIMLALAADDTTGFAFWNTVDPPYLQGGAGQIWAGTSRGYINAFLPIDLPDADSNVGGTSLWGAYLNDGENGPGQGPWIARLWLRVTA